VLSGQESSQCRFLHGNAARLGFVTMETIKAAANSRLMRLDQKPTSRKMTPIAQPPSMNERTSPGMRSGFSGT